MHYRKTFHSILVFAAIIFSQYVHAGVVVGGTRVIYDGSKREASLSVSNPDNFPYLIQAWTDADGPQGEKKCSAKPPFVITPPLFRLNSGNENFIRIIRTGGNIASDRESLYWMNIKSIPATKKEDKNVLQISIKTRIKFFYRPEGVASPDEQSYKKMTFHRSGNQLQVTNPTPWYITFYSLKVGGTSLTTTNVMVPPKGTATYSLPSAAGGKQVTWQLINDFGGSTKPVVSALQ